MRKSVVLALFAAALIGTVYSWASIQFWGFYAMDSALHNWLVDTLLRQGHRLLYHVSSSIHSALVNVVLAVPVAAIFLAVGCLNNWRYLLVAVVSAILVSHWGLTWSAPPTLFSSWGFWVGFITFAASLPIAFAGFRLFKNRSAQRSSGAPAVFE